MLKYILLLLGAISALGHENRIIGGNDAQQNQFPYMASIRYGGINEKHGCGAAILDSFTLITTASCVIGNTAPYFRLYIGDVNQNGRGKLYSIHNTIIHPKYKAFTKRHDIALIQASGSIEFSKSVTPVDLNEENILDNRQCYLTGWGNTSDTSGVSNKLQYVLMETMNATECRKIQTDRPIYKEQICTLPKAGKGGCTGDIGSPLVTLGGNKLVGIMSWMSPCAKGKPDVYTNIYSYLDWIEESR